GHRLGPHDVEPGGSGERLLELARDQLFHFARGHALAFRLHLDDRRRELGKDVNRHVGHLGHAEEHQHRGEKHHQVSKLETRPHHPAHGFTSRRDHACRAWAIARPTRRTRSPPTRPRRPPPPSSRGVAPRTAARGRRRRGRWRRGAGRRPGAGGWYTPTFGRARRNTPHRRERPSHAPRL